jgi:undecaprenyl-diphosphatase
MTAVGGVRQGAASPPRAFIAAIAGNLLAWTATLVGTKRKAARGARYRELLRCHRRQGLIALGLAAAAMIALDPVAATLVAALPVPVIEGFREVTDYGRSAAILYPAGILLIAIAAVDSPALERVTRGVLAALVVRIGFVFVAVAVPGLIGTVVKRLIGRVRPSARGPFAYEPFSWRPDYASLPSGHAMAVFSALVAIGLIFPRARPVLWVYAITIGLSRIAVSAHFPSDVIAGAAFGAIGALLVREWFAARRLGFVVDSQGVVRALPGPSFTRARRAIGAALAR